MSRKVCRVGAMVDFLVDYRFAEQSLDDDAVAPCAIQFAVSPIDAHLTKADAPMQRQAGAILGKDATDQFQQAESLGLSNQSFESQPPNAGTPARRSTYTECSAIGS